MCKIYYSFLFLFVCSGLVFAQNNGLSVSGKVDNGTTSTISTEAVLYDQTAPLGMNGSPSQFFSDFGGAGESADDFVVPAGLVWTIDSVFVIGSFNTGAGANFQSVDVNFHSNNAGIPGAIVEQRDGIIPTAPGPQYGVRLNPPVVLTEGTYWFNFMVNMAFNPGGSQFFWSQLSSAQVGSFRAFRDSINLFGTGLFTNWQSAQGSGIGGGLEANLSFALFGNSGVIPVELISFTAAAVNDKVTLNWSTATEVNNNGFQVERNSGSGFVTVGFVNGKGTTTEVQNYSFTDAGIAAGSYTYRLKQVDFDGSFEYSSEVEVDVLGVREYALNQNFPNPFNPSTMISFSLAVDAKVNLKVFDILGQEVMTIVNNNLSAGAHEYTFDASNFNSGVYFYRVEATGVDGQNFTSVKKMILTK